MHLIHFEAVYAEAVARFTVRHWPLGFHEFTKLLFALSSFAQPFDRIRSIQEHIFIILSHRQACAGRFREETAGKRRGPVTKWPPWSRLFTRLEIVFVIISSFTK